MNNRNPYIVSGIIYLVLILGVFYFRYGIGLQLKNMDFQSYYAAGIAIDEGVNPYIYENLNSGNVKEQMDGKLVRDGYIFQHTREYNNLSYPYLYTPTLALVLSAGEFYAMRELWAVISIVALLISLFFVESSLSRVMKRWLAIVVSASLGVAGPFLGSIYIGQIEPIIFLALSMVLYILTSNLSKDKRQHATKWIWPVTGLICGLLLFIKPHVAFLIFLFPLFDKKVLIWVAIGAIIGFVIPTIAYPDALIQYIEFISGGVRMVGLDNLLSHKNSSFTSFLALFLPSDIFRMAAVGISALFCVVGIAILVRYKSKYGYSQEKQNKYVLPIMLYSVIVTTFLLYTPYLWYQHFTYYIFSILMIFTILGGHLKLGNNSIYWLLAMIWYYAFAVIAIERTEIGFVKIMPVLKLSTIGYYLYLLINGKEIQSFKRNQI